MEQYTIKVENFEGPLDVLCHLIDKNKMDICDIKISEITDQYIEFLNQMEEMNLDITSEFIVMAARLIYLKSKSLLPSIDEEDEESEYDLINMLLEYKKYKEFTFSLKERLEIYSQRIYKLPDNIKFPVGKLDRTYESSLIPNLYNNMILREETKKNIDAENINKLAIYEKVTIRSKIKEILKVLFKKQSFIFNKLFNTKQKSRIEVVTAFLSLLELSKLNRISVSQNKLFGDINVTKINKHKEA
jgi:segregation and condensation protein A